MSFPVTPSSVDSKEGSGARQYRVWRAQSPDPKISEWIHRWSTTGALTVAEIAGVLETAHGPEPILIIGMVLPATTEESIDALVRVVADLAETGLLPPPQLPPPAFKTRTAPASNTGPKPHRRSKVGRGAGPNPDYRYHEGDELRPF